jgi:hypothetical protein
MRKITIGILTTVILFLALGWLYLNYEPSVEKVDVSELYCFSSPDIPEQSVLTNETGGLNIVLKDGYFSSPYGRTMFLRGINLGGSNKVPYTPNMGSHVEEGFFDGQNVSFVGRPFPLDEADEHLSRLKAWGFHFIRFLVTWEAIEHAGPGIYDEDYIAYVKAVVKKADEYGLNVFIDPHQDLWSRFSGGDGAPLWTFEVAGMNVQNFMDTDAAFVHNTHGDPYPQMVWFSNYFKLGSATLFTLFFSGNDFAPQVMVNDTLPIQDYLQEHYIQSMVRLAKELKGLPNVIGFELMNEPSAGYVGVQDLSQPFPTSILGLAPTPWQGMLLGDGIPQKVKHYELGMASLKDKGEVWVNESGKSAWMNESGCIWKEAGVWGTDSDGTPQLLKPAYFTEVNGKKIDFNRDYYIPFVQAYEKAIHAIDPNWFICVDNVLFPLPHELPELKQLGDRHWVNGSHWYDDATLVTKQYIPWIGLMDDEIIFGKRKVAKAFSEFMDKMNRDTKQYYGENAVALLGEFGIPFDMNNRKAFASRDFSVQSKALDRCFQAVESNLLHYTLWNYTADNTNERGDQWNGEDLSVYSLSQVTDQSDINSGGRSLDAAVRPYPYKVAGELKHYVFNYKTGEMVIRFMPDVSVPLPTELFLPDYHYQQGFQVYVSSGSLSFDKKARLLQFSPQKRDVEQTIVVRKIEH